MRNLSSPVDDIVEIAQSFQSNYDSINIATDGVLPRDDSWSIYRMFIKDIFINEILKTKCSQSFFNIYHLR